MNTTPAPDEERIEKLLESIQPRPSEAYYRQMANAPWSQQEELIQKKHRLNLPLRIALATALVFVVWLVILFATPQGRAWAQNTLRFFTRTAGNTLPVTPYPTAGIVLVDTTPGVEPTPNPIPTTDIHTLIPFYDQCGNWASPTCTVDQVRSMVNFPVKELAHLPDDMRLIGATGGPDGVIIHYEREDRMGGIMLSQGPWTENLVEAWKVALTATVETALIGNVTGEYMKGSWSIAGVDAVTTWDPSSDLQTLRWQEGELFFTMLVFGLPEDQGQPLGKDGMAALAAGLTTQSVAIVPDTSQLKTIQEAEALAGFEVIEPGQLLEDFSFSHAAYSAEQNTVCLFYQYKDQDETFAPPLTIVQSTTPLPGFQDLPDPMYEENHIDPSEYLITRTTTIEGALGGQGVFLDNGSIDIGTLCGLARMPYAQGVIWQAVNGRYFALFYNRDAWVGTGYLTTLEMLDVVNELNGVTALPFNLVDPERLHSVQEAETLAGFDVKEPGKLPQGYAFDHATYQLYGQVRTVSLIYVRWNELGGGYNGFSISTSVGVTKTLEMMDAEVHDNFMKTSVNGQPALYVQGCGTEQGWDWNCFGTLDLTWFDDGVRYNIWAVVGDLNEETAVAIAESLH